MASVVQPSVVPVQNTGAGETDNSHSRNAATLIAKAAFGGVYGVALGAITAAAIVINGASPASCVNSCILRFFIWKR